MYSLILGTNLAPGQFCTYSHDFWRRSAASEAPHDHDFPELFWVEEGGGYHWINGQKRELKPGMLVLIRPEDAHGFGASQEGFLHIVNLAFPSSTWRALRKRYFSSQPCLFSLPSLQAREYHLDEEKMIAIRLAAQDLEAGGRDLLTVETFLLNLFDLLQTRGPAVKGLSTPKWLSKAVGQFQATKSFEEGTLQFAKISGRSPCHVARACRKYLGTTPTNILNDARMNYAAARLIQTNQKIVDIALDCGLESLGYFYGLFRSKFGQSPSAYRRQHGSPGEQARSGLAKGR